MTTRFSRWYNSLTHLKRVAVTFTFNLLFWFIGSLLEDRIFFDEQHSLAYHVFHATWMASFMTVLFNWKELKVLFKRVNNVK